jgi:hypothetical protein
LSVVLICINMLVLDASVKARRAGLGNCLPGAEFLVPAGLDQLNGSICDQWTRRIDNSKAFGISIATNRLAE